MVVYRLLLWTVLDGFRGGLSTANCSSNTGAPASTTRCGLADLFEIGTVRSTGEHRHARCWTELPGLDENREQKTSENIRHFAEGRHLFLGTMGSLFRLR